MSRSTKLERCGNTFLSLGVEMSLIWVNEVNPSGAIERLIRFPFPQNSFARPPAGHAHSPLGKAVVACPPVQLGLKL